MQSKTIKGKSPEEIQLVLKQCMENDFKPSLAIILLTNIDNAGLLRSIFNKNNIEIFGVSTSQKFTEQGMEQDDIVVLLLDISTDSFRIVLKDYDEDSAYHAAHQVGEAGVLAFKNSGFIISSADFRMSGDELINGLTDAAGKDATIMGGVAGNPADFSGILFTKNESTKRGIIALVIDQDKIEINGLAVSGWKPVGTEKRITKCDGTWVFTIDGEPAMNVIQRFLGNELITPSNHGNGLLPSDLGYPLQFLRPGGSVIMKPVLFWNTNDKSIMIGGEVQEGDVFRFSLPPDFDVIDRVVESTTIVKEKKMPDADAMMVFSCVGRLGTFGPMISTEIEGLAATWNKPMIGFFSLGEFGKLNEGRCEYHGTTVSWVALKEK
ncbi:MAG: FIST C-terminal domain-containing protein [Ferruginibacter sp.]|nr:FIST C-terminal domain-containing protein [Bacteroidota bacterium]MBX2919950.1 FIST C-terminal domain-containing protein [Ferruginibacter sp.]